VTGARRVRVGGTVQGVGFRPFVARLAESHRLAGWVLNGLDGVEIHVEGMESAMDAFTRALQTQAPPAARIESVQTVSARSTGASAFSIIESQRHGRPTARISPDLPVCGDCLREMRDPGARRFAYPYINCTNCGPRYSVVRALPYDRERTTMARWPLCDACAAEYSDPGDRRFHAEPIACPGCGPRYRLIDGTGRTDEAALAMTAAARLLRQGALVAIKGIGGYHVACDARNTAAVSRLRDRKYRKSKPFAVMACDLAEAHALVALDARTETVLTSPARPIVLAPAHAALPGVAPGYRELGVMLPYAPVHYLLFEAGAPAALVMTSANRSSEPLAFEDADAVARLEGIADAILAGERGIARRVDDSVVRATAGGPIVLRRGRGYAPARVAALPGSRPILALGADLKNTITLVVRGAALMSPYIGDLEHASARDGFQSAVDDLLAMYDVSSARAIVAHDLHPEYASTAHALRLESASRVAVQHHRAHVASVLAEYGALDIRVAGVAFDGAGYGDDGTIWGGEFFAGSVAEGLVRTAWLRPFALPGGDAAARSPVQALAGLLADVGPIPDLTEPPFSLPPRYGRACDLARARLRTFTCTSSGRLFDAAAAILGFTRDIEYEGQAAAWLERLAWSAPEPADPLPFETGEQEVDVRPALLALIESRRAGHDSARLARAFHETMAALIAEAAERICHACGADIVVLSGGTFQNSLLLELVRKRLAASLRVWTNHVVPPNDGGISLGQAACAAFAPAPAFDLD
jgi:hydrogenase maturation protein HypF